MKGLSSLGCLLPRCRARCLLLQALASMLLALRGEAHSLHAPQYGGPMEAARPPAFQHSTTGSRLCHLSIEHAPRPGAHRLRQVEVVSGTMECSRSLSVSAVSSSRHLARSSRSVSLDSASFGRSVQGPSTEETGTALVLVRSIQELSTGIGIETTGTRPRTRQATLGTRRSTRLFFSIFQ